MPSSNRSVSALVIAVILVIGIGGYSWWQKTQKEAQKAKIFRAMAHPVPTKQSTPEEQKAILDAVTGNKKDNHEKSPSTRVEPLNFNGAPYLMFTHEYLGKQKHIGQPTTYCFYPDGRVLTIRHADPIEYPCGLSCLTKDKDGKILEGGYLNEWFKVEQWKPDTEGHIVVCDEREIYNNFFTLHRNKDGTLRLIKDELLSCYDDVSYWTQEDWDTFHEKLNNTPPNHYRIGGTPEHTQTLCALVTAYLNGFKLHLPQHFIDNLFKEASTQLNLPATDIYPCQLYRDDDGTWLFRLMPSSHKPPLKPAQDCLKPHVDDISKCVVRFFEDMPYDLRPTAEIKIITLLSPDKMKVDAISPPPEPDGWDGAFSSEYIFERRRGLWVLINESSWHS